MKAAVLALGLGTACVSAIGCDKYHDNLTVTTDAGVFTTDIVIKNTGESLQRVNLQADVWFEDKMQSSQGHFGIWKANTTKTVSVPTGKGGVQRVILSGKAETMRRLISPAEADGIRDDDPRAMFYAVLLRYDRPFVRTEQSP
jgi:hypothetical protein